MERMWLLYSCNRSFRSDPHRVEWSFFSMFSAFRLFCFTVCRCLFHVRRESKTSPRNFQFSTSSICALLRKSWIGWVWCRRVKTISLVFDDAKRMPLCIPHFSSLLHYIHSGQWRGRLSLSVLVLVVSAVQATVKSMMSVVSYFQFGEGNGAICL